MMLTAHSGHLLHPEYLQPLTTAAASIELDAKKSPLALLAQTCSQIGKPDPPTSSSMTSSMSAGTLPDKEAVSRATCGGLKPREHRPSLEDKSGFKPFAKAGADCRREAVSSTTRGPGAAAGGEGGAGPGKAHFRVHHSGVGCGALPPHAASPPSRLGTASPPNAHAHAQHGHTHSPSVQHTHTHAPGHRQHRSTADSTNLDSGRKGVGPNGCGGVANADSSHGCSSPAPSSEGSSSPPPPSRADAPLSLGHTHIASVSPFKAGHPAFPLSPPMGYHGSLVGAYGGYPSPYASGLEPSRVVPQGAVGGVGAPGGAVGAPGGAVGGVGAPGKHPSSSPLSGASPPSFLQGLCRDPYCLNYPSATATQLGGASCSSSLHDPSSSSSSSSSSATLKTGFPLLYPPHPLHVLHTGPAPTSPLPHPLYAAYSFLLPGDSVSHACNWVSAGVGPCDKRFSSSEDLLAHLRTHTAPLHPPSPAAAIATACHMHLPQASLSPLALRTTPTLGLARYHPYGKVALPASLPLHSLPVGAPYYSHYALYGQKLASQSTLGYQ